MSGKLRCAKHRRNPICRTGLQRILAGRVSDWPPAAFYCPRFFFGERLPNARRSRARALLAPRTGQTVRGRAEVGVRVRVRVGVGWGLCRYLGQKCAKASCKNSLQARPANRGSHKMGQEMGTGAVPSDDNEVLVKKVVNRSQIMQARAGKHLPRLAFSFRLKKTQVTSADAAVSDLIPQRLLLA